MNNTENVLNKNNIILGEILNPQVYTGIVERDYHLYEQKTYKKEPNYVHIEVDSKPKCTCQMYAKKYNLDYEDKCKHILYVLNEILNLNTSKNELIYNECELKNAFESSEKKYINIIRETYGITKRKNFKFPNPKKYIYEYDEDNDEDGYESHEWRIKERLYSRGIVAEEFHASDNDYSLTEDTYDNFFTSEKEAKPTQKVYEEPVFSGKQLKLDKKYKEDEK